MKGTSTVSHTQATDSNQHKPLRWTRVLLSWLPKAKPTSDSVAHQDVKNRNSTFPGTQTEDIGKSTSII